MVDVSLPFNWVSISVVLCQSFPSNIVGVVGPEPPQNCEGLTI